MNYLITESRLEDLVLNYLDKMFPTDNISWTSPEEYDDASGLYVEDTNRMVFFIGPSALDDNAFRWYDCEYFNPDSPAQEICPTVALEPTYSNVLNSYFGETWIEPFKKWFTLNFELPVKTVEWM